MSTESQHSENIDNNNELSEVSTTQLNETKQNNQQLTSMLQSETNKLVNDDDDDKPLLSTQTQTCKKIHQTIKEKLKLKSMQFSMC